MDLVPVGPSLWSWALAPDFSFNPVPEDLIATMVKMAGLSPWAIKPFTREFCSNFRFQKTLLG